MAWVLGNRDTETFQRLYDKVKHLKDCMFYSDNWDAFSNVLPPERHVIGKAFTTAIESDNSNTRHHLGRFTRRSKVISRCEYMVDITLKAWQAIYSGSLFEFLRATALSLF